MASLLSMGVHTVSWAVLKGGPDSMLCALLVTWLLLDWDCWHFPLPLHPLDVLQDCPVPSSQLFGPALGTEMILISTIVALFAPCWGILWVDEMFHILPHILPLLLVLALA